jgi:hypothetical protein
MKTFLIVGLIGFGAALVINLVAMLGFSKAEATFFSDPWWSSWFPNYVVWLVFAIIGLGQVIFAEKSSKEKDESK